MKKSRILLYLIYLGLILGYIFFSKSMLISLRKQSQYTFTYFPYYLYAYLINVFFGIVLGLENFITEFKKEGRWTINLPRLLILGLPLLYFSLGLFFIFMPFRFLYDYLANPIILFLGEGVDFITFFQIFLGYIICTSFIKVKIDYI